MTYKPFMSAVDEAAAYLKGKATDLERIAADQPVSQERVADNLDAIAVEIREAAAWLEDGKP